jgi:hypothetical protein
MFTAIAERERLLNEYIDSSKSRFLSRANDDSSFVPVQHPNHESAAQYTVGTSQQSRLEGGDCVDETYDAFMMEQPMEFATHAPSLNTVQHVPVVEPIPYHGSNAANARFQPLAPPQQQHHQQQQQQQQRFSVLHNNPRSSISALSIDWDTTLELLNEFDSHNTTTMQIDQPQQPQHFDHYEDIAYHV